MNRKAVAILTGIVLTSGVVSLWVWSARSERPARRKAMPQIMVIPPPQPDTPKYRKALAAYLSKIESIKKAEKRQRDELMKGAKIRHRKKDDMIAAKEAELLQRLYKEAAEYDGKVGLEDYCEGMKAYSATSPASARIFYRIVKERKVNEEVLILILSSDSYQLDKAWIPVFQHVADKAKPDSRIYRACISNLYRLDPSNEKYRKIIEQWPDGPVTFLSRYDKETGDPIPIRSAENMVLMKRLSDRRFAPVTRAACASYAAKIGERALALAICKEILWTAYKPRRTDSRNDPDYEDLRSAKCFVLDTLFYDIGGEDAFLQVYQFAVLPYIEDHNRHRQPNGFSYDDVAQPGSMEVEHAQSMIYEVGVDLDH